MALSDVDDRALRVGFLSPSWPIEGATNGIVTYVDTITAALRRQGHTVCILSAHSNNSSADPQPDVYQLVPEEPSLLARILAGLTFRISPSEALRQKYGRDLVRAGRRAITEGGLELLEMEESFGLVQLVKSRLLIPIVVRLHGPHFVNGPAAGVPVDADFRKRIRQEGVGIGKADAVSAPSRDILEQTRAYYGLSLTGAAVIPNAGPAVPPEKRWSLASCDPSRVLFIGRFDRHKGGDVVIDAFRKLAQRLPQLRLWFVGLHEARSLADEQGRRWKLAEYIAERAPDVADRIDCLGPLPQAALGDLRREAFLTIVGSRYENMPMVVLEAIAYGCPLVATRTGGIVEIIQDGVNGLMAKPGDPDDLASGIMRLLGDREFAARLGQRAGEDAERRYHPDVIARETAAFYQTVLDSSIPRNR
ncbi:glycosyltransferase family 4 protein [Candidatus Binatus sp.]|uniref:glycosyltransferase family 4 protein n=1 Tax=Candidatus Binatus sp. TaxID=2811406 RepID=UPI003BAF1C16